MVNRGAGQNGLELTVNRKGHRRAGLVLVDCARGAWRCCKLDRSASDLSRRAVAKARAKKWLLEPRQGEKVTRNA